MFGHQHRPRSRFQDLEDVPDIGRVGGVVAGMELHRFIGDADQRPAGAEHDVFHHSGHVRLGCVLMTWFGRNAVDVAPCCATFAPVIACSS